jgi:hypothetical protein
VQQENMMRPQYQAPLSEFTKVPEGNPAELPVPIGTQIEVLRRSGQREVGKAGIDEHFKTHFFRDEGHRHDIVAWRLDGTTGWEREPDDMPLETSEADAIIPLLQAPKPAPIERNPTNEDTAPGILEKAARIMRERAVEYDQPGGERSIAATVAAFNAQTGRDLTEAEGWLFMVNLKLVRGFSAKTPHRDSIDDCTAYAALLGEAKLKEGN